MFWPSVPYKEKLSSLPSTPQGSASPSPPFLSLSFLNPERFLHSEGAPYGHMGRCGREHHASGGHVPQPSMFCGSFSVIIPRGGVQSARRANADSGIQPGQEVSLEEGRTFSGLGSYINQIRGSTLSPIVDLQSNQAIWRAAILLLFTLIKLLL